MEIQKVGIKRVPSKKITFIISSDISLEDIAITVPETIIPMVANAKDIIL